MTWSMWLIVGFVLMACEMLTLGAFYFMFLGISGVIVGLLSLAIPMPEWVTWLLFSAFAAISLIFFRKPLMEKFKLKKMPKVDSLVGETAITLDDIDVSSMGKAELRGAAWSARNVGDRRLTKSERCKVEHVDGLTLEIRNQ